MRIYKYSGNGLYMGAEVIVIANDFSEAEKLIDGELYNIGAPQRKSLNQIEEIEIENSVVVHSYNGDY
jgi:hypothetical protein